MLVNGVEKSNYDIEREQSAQRYIKSPEYLDTITALKKDIELRDKREKELKEKLNKINKISQIGLI